MPETSYRELADYYDLIYHWKDYSAECEKLEALIRQHCHSGGRELLDVACGTGMHMALLRKRYSVWGMDLSADMLAVARRNFKGLRLKKADMTTFTYSQRFDAITCLFSAIGHLKTYAKLERAIERFARHLKPGGVLIIEPFISPSEYRTGKPFSIFVNLPELQIARMNVASRKGNLAILDFHYQIATPKGVSRYRDYVEIGLFAPSRVVSLLKKHGLDARFLKNGLMKNRGLYLAKKPL